MCEAIIDLFRDEYDKGIAEAKQVGVQQGLQQGIQQGVRENILSLFRKGLLSMKDAAGELNITVEEFEKMVSKEETTHAQEI